MDPRQALPMGNLGSAKGCSGNSTTTAHCRATTCAISSTTRCSRICRSSSSERVASNTIEYKIGEVFGEIKDKITRAYNLREIIDHIEELRFRSAAEKHELSHLYKAKIRKMGNAGRNGGEYYTPRPLIRAMVRVTAPRLGERIYDGACGSAGFLCEAFDYLGTEYPKRTTAQDKHPARADLLRQGEEIARLRERHQEHGSFTRIEAPTSATPIRSPRTRRRSRRIVTTCWPTRPSAARSARRSSRISQSVPARLPSFSCSTSSKC